MRRGSRPNQIHFNESDVVFVARPARPGFTLEAALLKTLKDGSAVKLPAGEFKNMKSACAATSMYAKRHKVRYGFKSNGTHFVAWFEKEGK